MTDDVTVQLTVNGTETGERTVPGNLSLLDFLNEELGLTGTKFCCGIAVCRACTVAVRRTPESPATPTLSCSTPVRFVDGQSVDTVEGLAEGETLTALQQSFLDNFAFQCGYCTPGFLMATNMLIERLTVTPIPASQLDDAIADAVGPHICRCTGYIRYYQAIRQVIEQTPGLLS